MKILYDGDLCRACTQILTDTVSQLCVKISWATELLSCDKNNTLAGITLKHVFYYTTNGDCIQTSYLQPPPVPGGPRGPVGPGGPGRPEDRQYK